MKSTASRRQRSAKRLASNGLKVNKKRKEWSADEPCRIRGGGDDKKEGELEGEWKTVDRNESRTFNPNHHLESTENNNSNYFFHELLLEKPFNYDRIEAGYNPASLEENKEEIDATEVKKDKKPKAKKSDKAKKSERRKAEKKEKRERKEKKENQACKIEQLCGKEQEGCTERANWPRYFGRYYS